MLLWPALATLVQVGPDAAGGPQLGTLPPLYPEWLGDRDFGAVHGVRFPYVAGEMARGIATTRMVIAMARAEMLAFFGAAGLDVATIERAVHELSSTLGGNRGWGVNLIHSPAEPALEERTADLLLRSDVPIISASAYMDITPPLARCAVAGLRLDPAGRIVRPVRIFAKVSRPEVAEKFMSPAPAGLLASLMRRGTTLHNRQQLTDALDKLGAQTQTRQRRTQIVRHCRQHARAVVDEALEPLLYAELEKCKRFEVIPVSPEQLKQWTGKIGWRADEPLPPDIQSGFEAGG